MKSSVIVNTAFEEKERNAMGYLISETTKEEREKIVAESLGNIDAACDGDRKSTRLNSSHYQQSRMPSSA